VLVLSPHFRRASRKSLLVSIVLIWNVFTGDFIQVAINVFSYELMWPAFQNLKCQIDTMFIVGETFLTLCRFVCFIWHHFTYMFHNSIVVTNPMSFRYSISLLGRPFNPPTHRFNPFSFHFKCFRETLQGLPDAGVSVYIVIILTGTITIRLSCGPDVLSFSDRIIAFTLSE